MNQCFIVKININLTIDNLKAAISHKSNIPEEHFKIKFNYKSLIGSQTIKETNLKEGDTIEMKFELKGG